MIGRGTKTQGDRHGPLTHDEVVTLNQGHPDALVIHRLCEILGRVDPGPDADRPR